MAGYLFQCCDECGECVEPLLSLSLVALKVLPGQSYPLLTRRRPFQAACDRTHRPPIALCCDTELASGEFIEINIVL